MVDIEQLRKDVAFTADREGWSREETLEIGAEIRAVIDKGDQEALALWAQHMGWQRLMVAQTAKGINARVRAAIERQPRRAA